MAYATLTQFKQLANKATSTASEDAAITLYLAAATENIDRALNVYADGCEYFNAAVAATARQFPGSGGYTLRIPACIEITSVETRNNPDDTWETMDAGDYTPASGSPRAPQFYRLPYTLLVAEEPFPKYSIGKGHHPTVRITARWGYSDSPPNDIVAACVEQASRWYKRAQSAMADTLADGDVGTLIYTRALDPDIERKLLHGRYTVPTIGKH